MINKINKNIIKIIFGSGIAQAIPILISPILTRIYSPEDFGTIGLITAISGILAVILCLTYDQAIVLPRKVRGSVNLLVSSLIIAIIITIITYIILFVTINKMLLLINDENIKKYIKIIPLISLIIIVNQILLQWNLLKRNFNKINNSKIYQSLSTVIIQLTYTKILNSWNGLLIGMISGQIISIFILSKVILKDKYRLIKLINKKEIKKVLLEYIKFPKYMLVGQLANVISSNIFIIFIAFIFGPINAGFFALAQRVLVVPTSLITNSIGEVYKIESTFLYKSNGECKKLFLQILYKLIISSVIITMPCLVLGKELFVIVFGNNWAESGEIAQILSIMVFFQGFCTPLAHTVLLAGLQKLDMFWQILRLCVTITAIYVGEKTNDLTEMILIYCIGFSVLYLMHFIIQYYCSLGKFNLNEQ